jgi:hypothetical protein
VLNSFSPNKSPGGFFPNQHYCQSGPYTGVLRERCTFGKLSLNIRTQDVMNMYHIAIHKSLCQQNSRGLKV